MLWRSRSAALWAALGAIGVVGIAFRQISQRNWSYWLDEAMQVSYVRGSLRDLWGNLRFDGVHPPFDYLLAWAAYHLGSGHESVLRLMPALWMTAASMLVFRLADGERRPVRGFSGAVFVLVTPLSIYLGQEVRPYAFAILMVTVVAAVLETTGRGVPNRLLWASIASVLAVMTLYLAFVPVAVLWGSELWSVRRDRSLLGRTLTAAAAPTIVLGGWLWLVRTSIARHAEGIPADVSLGHLVALANGLLGWREERPQLLMGAILPCVLIGVGVFGALRRGSWNHPVMLLGTTLGVVALLAAAHHWINLRYLALALVPGGVLFGEGMDLLAAKRPRLCVALLGVFVVLHTPAYLENFRSARPNWRQVATYLSYQERAGVRGEIYGVDAWSYLCLRVQPLVADRVRGIASAAGVHELLGGEGWLVRTPHYTGGGDTGGLVAGKHPWARFPEAEHAHIYRVRNGQVVQP